MVLSEISSFSVKWLMSRHMDRFIIRFVFSKTFSKVDFNLAFLLSYTKCLVHVLPKRIGMVLGDGSYLFIIAGLHFGPTFLKHNVVAWNDFQNAFWKLHPVCQVRADDVVIFLQKQDNHSDVLLFNTTIYYLPNVAMA